MCVSPQRHDLTDELLPRFLHVDALMGKEAGASAFTPGHCGRAATLFASSFGHASQDGCPREHDAEHEEGSRFLLLSMHLAKKVRDWLAPVFPSESQCIH
jgi:hypothetical protein